MKRLLTTLKTLILKISFLLIFTSSILSANDSSQVNYYKLGAYTGLSAGAFVYGQISQYDAYWSDRTDFYIMDWQTEYDDALLADKGGHFFFAYFLARSYAAGLEWTGLSKKKSAWVAFGVSVFHQSYVEINDGFSEGEIYLGFSRGDMIANLMGSTYALAEVYYPSLQNFEFKISFNKSANYERNNYEVITHDYESTYHWISVDIFDLLNYEKGFWTDFTRIAFGHSTINLDRFGSGQHEFYIALDWNLKAFNRFKFVKKNSFLQAFITAADHYKLPSPMVRIHPNVVWYGLRF